MHLLTRLYGTNTPLQDANAVYTGPSCRENMKQYFNNPDIGTSEDWKMFVSAKRVTGEIKLKKHTSVLISVIFLLSCIKTLIYCILVYSEF